MKLFLYQVEIRIHEKSKDYIDKLIGPSFSVPQSATGSLVEQTLFDSI